MKKSTLVIFSVLIAVVVIFSTAAVIAAPVNKVNVLIGFDRVPGPDEEAIVHAFGGDIKFTYSIIPAVAASVPEAAIQGLLRNPRVTVIEPDIEIQAVDEYPWGITQINADIVQQSGYNGQGVKVAVIDTGIDYNHPELKDAYAGGYDFVNGDNDPMDDNGHGTHVSGTIAAEIGNGGIIGAAPAVELYALKVLDANGSGSFSNIIAALQWATGGSPGSVKVDVTNNSYGSTGDPGLLVRWVFNTAYNTDGVLSVAAAGNEGSGTDTVIYPAKYDSVIAVAATDSNNNRAYFSSTGAEVELAAPGYGIYSTVPGGGYATWSGTSMATPHVTGAAALVMSAHSSWTAEQVRTRLQATAYDLGSQGRDTWYGYGLVDAAAAADVLPSGNNPPVAHDDTATTNEDISVAINVLANDADADSDILSVIAVGFPSHGSTVINVDDIITYTPVSNYNGADIFSYTIGDGKGGTSTASVTVNIAPVNDAPVAHDDTATTNEDISVGIDVLANDSDVDGDALNVVAVTQPGNGAASIGTDNRITYTPGSGYNGVDSFTYTISDGSGYTDTANVVVTVTASPGSGNIMNIELFDMYTDNRSAGKNVFTWAVLTLKVVDDSDAPVSGVSIGGSWSGLTRDSDTAVTGVDGTATFTSDSTKKSRGTFTFSIESVIKDGWTIDIYNVPVYVISIP